MTIIFRDKNLGNVIAERTEDVPEYLDEKAHLKMRSLFRLAHKEASYEARLIRAELEKEKYI